MSVDYKVRTYRPELFKDTHERTSYSKMHTWMTLKPKDEMYRPPQVSTPPPKRKSSRRRKKMLKNLIVPKLSDYESDAYLSVAAANPFVQSNIPMMHFGYDVMSQGDSKPVRKQSFLPKLVYKSFEDDIAKVDISLFAGAMPPVHMQYYKSGGYDDHHKAALKQSRNDQISQAFPTSYAPTTIRNGQCGSNWRHVKEVQPAAQAHKQVYIDGQISRDDSLRKYESPRASPRQRPVPRRSLRNSGLPHDPHFTPRMIVLDAEEKIEKIEFEDIQAQKGIESNNWHLLR